MKSRNPLLNKAMPCASVPAADFSDPLSYDIKRGYWTTTTGEVAVERDWNVNEATFNQPTSITKTRESVDTTESSTTIPSLAPTRITETREAADRSENT